MCGLLSRIIFRNLLRNFRRRLKKTPEGVSRYFFFRNGHLEEHLVELFLILLKEVLQESFLSEISEKKKINPERISVSEGNRGKKNLKENMEWNTLLENSRRNLEKNSC